MSEQNFFWPSFDESVLGDDEQYKWDATNWNREPHLAKSFKEAGDAIIEAFIASRGRHRSLFFPHYIVIVIILN